MSRATVSLRDFLDQRCVSLDLKGSTKEEIIEEMIDLMSLAGGVDDRADALRAILDREAKMSTGMQNGVAIPHGKTDKVNALVTAVAIRKDAVDFDALDGQPCNIFVMTLSPSNSTGPHIQFLSEISRILSDEGNRERLASAESVEAVFDILG